MVAPDPRLLAIDLLVRVEGGAFLDATLGPALETSALDPRDSALLTRLVYGTAAWQARLDWTLEAALRRPLRALEPKVRAALRLGALQLLHLDRIPPHAAVAATVEALRRAGGGRATGLVNAVLRRIAREGERPLPAAGGDRITRLAIEHSHPRWLVELWREELGHDAAVALMRANNTAAPTALRADGLSPERAIAALASRGLVARRTRFAPTGIEIDGPLAPRARLDGLFPQSEPSQLVAELLGVGSGERILDACAAPGGKALALAQATGRSGLVLATDRSTGGLARVGSLRTRAPALAPVAADARRPPWPEAVFDAALVDAPCTGLGTLRSHPEIRWRRQKQDPRRLGRLQLEILRAVSRSVRSGGRLVYSTCTITNAENEAVVGAFLEAEAGWVRVDARPHLPPVAASLVDDRGTLRTRPDRDGLDGFFAVRLERLA